MRYEIPDPLDPALLTVLIAAEDGLARLDERAGRHAVAEGFRERGQFFDAAAALGSPVNSCMSRIWFYTTRIWTRVLRRTS